jgi:uncharacterized phage protein gp47/JayE
MITIPTLLELYNSIISDLESELGVTIPPTGKSFLRSLAATQAGKLKLYYLGIGNLQKNIFVDTADPESTGGTLERWGRIKLGRNPFPAIAGQYTIEITGSIGAVVAGSTTFKSDDDSANPGKLYVLDNEYTLIATTDTITVRALTSGLDGQLAIGDTMTATAPIASVDSQGEVTVEYVEPEAAEDIEEYRRKTEASFKLESQGGAATDYRLWCADAQGVQQVYPYAKSGAANEINLYVESTTDHDEQGIPSASLLEEVEEVVEFNPDDTLELNERGRRPLGVFEIHYLPITPLVVSIIINGLIGSTAAIEETIQNALKEDIDTIRPFVAGADILEDKNSILDTNRIIAGIIAARPGSIFTSVQLTVDGNIVSTYEFQNGDIPFIEVASITFT